MIIISNHCVRVDYDAQTDFISLTWQPSKQKVRLGNIFQRLLNALGKNLPANWVIDYHAMQALPEKEQTYLLETWIARQKTKQGKLALIQPRKPQEDVTRKAKPFARLLQQPYKGHKLQVFQNRQEALQWIHA